MTICATQSELSAKGIAGVAPQHKGLVIIFDGIGDRPCAALGGATPLESAVTPALDALADRGLCGMMDPLYPSVPVDTHTGTGILMGLSPRDASRLSRGPVEAAGVELPIQNGDVALRANFATLEPCDGEFRAIDRRAGRISTGTSELAAVLTDVSLGHDIVASLRPATQHRAVVHLSGPNLSGRITDTDPGAGNTLGYVATCEPLDADNAEAVLTAEALNEFLAVARERFTDHPVNIERLNHGLPPANGIITRGAGKLGDLRNTVMLIGLRAALVSGECTVKGLGRLFGYTVVSQPTFTARQDTDLDAKVAATEKALESHDLVFLHIKAPDICSHDMDADGKRAFLQRADAAIGRLFSPDRVVAVTGDHSTDSNVGRHVGDPVPSILCAPLGRRDRCRGYGETSCMSGGLGRISGHSLLLAVLDAMGVLSNYRPIHDPYLFRV